MHSPCCSFVFIILNARNRYLNHARSHDSSSNSSNVFKLACRQFDSVETAILKVHDYVTRRPTIDNGNVTALILLNLSATFDTIDHTLLVIRMSMANGMRAQLCIVLLKYWPTLLWSQTVRDGAHGVLVFIIS